VYLSKNPYQTTQEENTPVSIRLQASSATVKALQTRLQDAYRRDDVRLVRRISVLLALLPQTTSVPVLCERWGLSPACLYAWQKAFVRLPRFPKANLNVYSMLPRRLGIWSCSSL
jgi:hypothetical protein